MSHKVNAKQPALQQNSMLPRPSLSTRFFKAQWAETETANGVIQMARGSKNGGERRREQHKRVQQQEQREALEARKQRMRRVLRQRNPAAYARSFPPPLPAALPHTAPTQEASRPLAERLQEQRRKLIPLAPPMPRDIRSKAQQQNNQLRVPTTPNSELGKSLAERLAAQRGRLRRPSVPLAPQMSPAMRIAAQDSAPSVAPAAGNITSSIASAAESRQRRIDQRPTLDLPSPYTGGKPDKPDKLKAKDSKGNPLAFHHKFPSNKIVAEANEAITEREKREKLEQWATHSKRTKDTKIGIKGLAWTPHNLFVGPLPNDRAEDPGGGDPDTHFTKSGNVTPRSELALELANEGGITQLDPSELYRRLAELPSTDVSGYESDEWEDTDAGKRQKGKPQDWASWSLEEKRDYARKNRTRK